MAGRGRPRGACRRGGRLVVVLALAAIAAAWAGAPAGATLLTRPATTAMNARQATGRPHVLPAIGAAPAGQSCATTCSLVSLHSGGVVQHRPTVYFIFWLPSAPA